MGEAGSVEEAIEMCRANSPDVVLMDMDEATSESLAGMRRLRDECPDGALVVMTRRRDDEEIYRAVVGGAVGHLADNAQPEELVSTVMRAAAGDEPISRTLAERPAVGRRVLESYAAMHARGPQAHEPRLSDRELTILGHAAVGMTNQQIGRALGVSEHTIKSDISHILARLGLRHRTQAVVHAMRNGWIAPSHVPELPGSAREGRFTGTGRTPA